jgi:hypothetical protein
MKELYVNIDNEMFYNNILVKHHINLILNHVEQNKHFYLRNIL